MFLRRKIAQIDPPNAATQRMLETERLKMLGDGIFAIVMTLLVLDLRVPENLGQTNTDLISSLNHLWPNFLSFVISFVVLGIFWIAHNLMMHYINHTTRKLFWINILFFLFISLFPFCAAFLSQYYDRQIAIFLYGAELIMTSLILAFLWFYATRITTLAETDFPPEFNGIAMKYMMIAPVLYVLAIVISFWSPSISLLIFFLTPIYYILPSAIDRYLPFRKRAR